VVSVGSFALNGLLNAWFVLGLHAGIKGSAIGTVIAQTLSAVVYLVVTVRRAREHGAPLSPDVAGVRNAGTAGFALFIRTLSLQLVLVIATMLASRIGDGRTELDAYTVAWLLWTTLAFALDAIAIAGQAITGRALGAGDVPGTR